MSKLVDYALTGVGKSLMFLANMFRYLWYHRPWRRSGANWWARMALVDGHGKMRNWPCFCRSGLKFKRCCGATVGQKTFWARQHALHVERNLERLRIKNLVHLHA